MGISDMAMMGETIPKLRTKKKTCSVVLHIGSHFMVAVAGKWEREKKKVDLIYKSMHRISR